MRKLQTLPLLFRNFLFITVLSGSVLAMSSCDKGTDFQPADFGPASAITGTVIVTDEFQNPLPADQQPTVTLDVTPQNGGEGTTTSATAQGGTEFSINNVAGGLYDITISAEGFRPLLRPGWQHGGGTPSKIDTMFLIRESSTTADNILATPVTRVEVLRILNEIILTAGNSLTVTLGDTIIFLNRQVTPNVNVVFVPAGPTTLTYAKDTIFFKPTLQYTFTTNLVVEVKISVPSTDSLQRGALIVFSSDPELSADKYTIVQTRLQVNPAPTNDTLSIKIPIATLQSAGIITQANRRVYVAAYGISGTLYAYGATIDEDRITYKYPSRNGQRSEVKFADF